MNKSGKEKKVLIRGTIKANPKEVFGVKIKPNGQVTQWELLTNATKSEPPVEVVAN